MSKTKLHENKPKIVQAIEFEHLYQPYALNMTDNVTLENKKCYHDYLAHKCRSICQQLKSKRTKK